jgi:hypothetical protein
MHIVIKKMKTFRPGSLSRTPEAIQKSARDRTKSREGEGPDGRGEGNGEGRDGRGNEEKE